MTGGLFVFPDLAGGSDPEGLTKAIVHLADKALVLSQDSVWRDLLAAAAKQEPPQRLRRHILEVLTDNGCLPTQVPGRYAEAVVASEFACLYADDAQFGTILASLREQLNLHCDQIGDCAVTRRAPGWRIALVGTGSPASWYRCSG